MRAWNKLHTYRGTGTVSSWLMQVAYSEYLQTSRKNRRYDEVLGEYETDSSMRRSAAEDTQADHVDLDRLLEILSENERAVMILNYSFGMSHNEIAKLTGLAIGTVKSHIQRSKVKIRKKFQLRGVADE